MNPMIISSVIIRIFKKCHVFEKREKENSTDDNGAKSLD